jgi:hypothetical protein
VTFGLLLLAALLWLNVRATRRVLASDLDGYRKKLFVAGVWFVPFFGALAVKDVARPAPAQHAESREREPAPMRIPLPDGTSFDLAPHLGAANGVPLVDWDAAGAMVEKQPSQEQPQATLAVRRAWLLHLADALGSHFALHESQDAIVLSSLDAVTANALLRYVSATRGRIQRVLQDVAHFPPGEKSIVVVLDDEDSYYHYVATYYPDGGEFAFSGGMFIHAGCPHFVVKRGELQSVEPVIAHELTHSALAHLDLPLWIDEGLAVNTEHRLAGVSPGLHTPQQLHAMHVAFWDAKRIQEFWSGRSFQRTDDGNLLSYDLARILVADMSRDWTSFAAFVQQAQRADAGRDAAARLLSMDLGAAVCALFDKAPGSEWVPDQLASSGAAPA